MPRCNRQRSGRPSWPSGLTRIRQRQCPWLVPLFNAFYDDAKVYTVLELMDGGDLATRLQEGPLPPRDVCEVHLRE